MRFVVPSPFVQAAKANCRPHRVNALTSRSHTLITPLRLALSVRCEGRVRLGGVLRSRRLPRAIFYRGADFASVEFTGNAGFDSAIFSSSGSGSASFESATFWRDAYFDSVTFSGN
jgi:hypothetical protein